MCAHVCAHVYTWGSEHTNISPDMADSLPGSAGPSGVRPQGRSSAPASSPCSVDEITPICKSGNVGSNPAESRNTQRPVPSPRRWVNSPSTQPSGRPTGHALRAWMGPCAGSPGGAGDTPTPSTVIGHPSERGFTPAPAVSWGGKLLSPEKGGHVLRAQDCRMRKLVKWVRRWVFAHGAGRPGSRPAWWQEA